MGRVGLIDISFDLLNNTTLELHSADETLLFGQKIGASLPSNTIIALYGDLGAGKTTFVNGLARGLGISDPIQSPTFILLNIYPSQIPLYHFDLYRLKDSSEFLKLGFEEYFQKGGVCVIEWPDRIASLLPLNTLILRFEYRGENGRTVTFSRQGEAC